jgi:hypothetical protein
MTSAETNNFDNILQQIVDQSNPEIPQEYEYGIADQVQFNENNENNETTNEEPNNVPSTIPDKLDLIALNNGWNDKNERIIISIGENAASYKWMHERSASYYKTTHNKRQKSFNPKEQR